MIAGACAGCTSNSPATQDETTDTVTAADRTATSSTPTTTPTDEATTDEATTDEQDVSNPGRIAPAGATVQLEQVAQGLGQPVDMFTLPAHDGRYYVANRSGQIMVIDEAAGTTEVVADFSDKLVDRTSWEQGFLSVVLHPDFQQNRKIYVRYSGPLLSDAPDDYSHTFVLAEHRMSEDGMGVKDGSERIILELPEPGPVHNGGGLAFGPDDGYLYVGVGDGGGGQFDSGPGHVADWYSPVDGGNGQDITSNLFGGILRIDIDNPSDDEEYSVPSDNPLVGKEGLDEHYAWGLRNPYTLSFGDGKLFVGDVGQDTYEEVNIVEKGGNYGWNVREGPGCLESSSCPTEDPDGNPLRDPIVWYKHRDTAERTTAVMGGGIYEGSVEPLVGTYVFGDLLRGGYGHLLSATPDGDEWTMAELTISNGETGTFPMGEAVLGFGTDNQQEMYVFTGNFGTEQGRLYRITSPS
jgi:glucose/arabinose dehydrogenase